MESSTSPDLWINEARLGNVAAVALPLSIMSVMHSSRALTSGSQALSKKYKNLIFLDEPVRQDQRSLCYSDAHDLLENPGPSIARCSYSSARNGVQI